VTERGCLDSGRKKKRVRSSVANERMVRIFFGQHRRCRICRVDIFSSQGVLCTDDISNLQCMIFCGDSNFHAKFFTPFLSKSRKNGRI
jgi:hypothetical protein